MKEIMLDITDRLEDVGINVSSVMGAFDLPKNKIEFSDNVNNPVKYKKTHDNLFLRDQFILPRRGKVTQYLKDFFKENYIEKIISSIKNKHEKEIYLRKSPTIYIEENYDTGIKSIILECRYSIKLKRKN